MVAGEDWKVCQCLSLVGCRASGHPRRRGEGTLPRAQFVPEHSRQLPGVVPEARRGRFTEGKD